MIFPFLLRNQLFSQFHSLHSYPHLSQFLFSIKNTPKFHSSSIFKMRTRRTGARTWPKECRIVKKVMIGLVRKIVAGPKNKTQWNGQELDLTYITERIIAMAFPASGFEKTYRNSIDDISEYFKSVHNGKCLIINVSMRKYNYELFNNLVKDYFWPDHQAPPLPTLLQICNDILEYMEKSKDGVVAVHCNHGKGRTGTCIIAYMLFAKQFNGAEQALAFYNKKRFIVDTYGVDQPCQRRYLDYVERILKTDIIQPKLKAFKLVKIRQTGLDINNNYIQISETRTCQTKHTKLHLNQILKNNSMPLMSDIFIQLYDYNWISESQAARINYNLNFLEQGNDGLYFVEFDGRNICVNGKRDRNFTVTLFFKQFCNCHNKLSKGCECAELREKEEGEWKIMIQIVQRSKKISTQEFSKYVYGANGKKAESNIMVEQPIKQIYS